jgi:mannose-6-phosphate isomerase-like protein (cupin superfamily)
MADRPDPKDFRPGSLRPIRRVVTGNDAQGRSRVLWDSASPNVNPQPNKPSGMTDVWVYPKCPVDLKVERDDGALPYHFEPPHAGGHLRIVQSAGKPDNYDAAADKSAVPRHPPKQTSPDSAWYQGGQNYFSSPYHKSETVDYGIVLEGQRILQLGDRELAMDPGDVVVQVGNWHGWTNRTSYSLMAFVMMGANFKG